MDIEYLLLLQQFRQASGGVLDRVFLALTHLGGASAMILVLAAVYWCIDKDTGEYLLLNALLGKVLNEAVKITACVPRPWLRDSRVVPLDGALDGATGYSFPSGHTTIAAALWGGLAVRCRKRRALTALFVVLWVLVAFSRNYVGVHTPQDVVVASVLGVGLLWVSARLLAWLAQKPGRDLPVAVGIVLAATALMVYAACKSYPEFLVNGVSAADPAQLRLDTFSTAGAAIGFGCGWLVERRAVHFCVQGSVLVRLVRFAVGVGSVLALYSYAGSVCALVLPQAGANALSMGILVFYLVAVYPWLFTVVERRAKRR